MTENNAAQPGLNDTIRAVFLGHGFTIKEGQTDLKPYVYEAVHALLSKLRAEGVQAGEPVAYSWEGSTTPRMLFRSAQRAAQWVQANGGKLTPLYAALASAPAAGAALPDVLPEMTTEGGAQYVSMATVQTVLSAARAALASAAVDAEAEDGDFMVRLFAELDTWRAEDWNELIERRPAILALLRPLVMASAPVAGEAQAKENYDEVKATMQGAHRIMEGVAAIERRVGPLGSHARGYTHKITNALRHLDMLYAAPQASGAVCSCPTGDGSLRHPCAVHPPRPTEQGERDAK